MAAFTASTDSGLVGLGQIFLAIGVFIAAFILL